ncbi:MAG: Holliday junction resolvase RuvX [Calditrichaceae bacterium]|nr:Holliday junction resolvase RuvX [Calditrichaceae bacterium]MBN2709042.1 Holliday junction resolvase RuvX [Calditrichaceae bacterium]RQV97001.1 MAG: Holliday junction resolvase RuvX [Calditrichota bacterium]
MKQKYLGIDLGEKRIGLAVSDELGMLAHPLQTLVFTNIDKLVSDLRKIIDDHNISGMVIGIPYTMKGLHSKKTAEILTQVDELKGKISVPVFTIDERLTTKMAQDALHAAGKKTGKSRSIIDQVAAVYILQSFLDSQKR